MHKLKNKFKFLKNKYFWIFIAIFAVGVFLRAYNFTPWLHFELDQARDATLIGEAVEDGAGNLPLLGPRAAGTFLRLGPAFYYIEYAFAATFGNTPQGSAFAVLFFAILSLPAFYLLFKRYFNSQITLALLAVFSASLFMVTYARFSWNPNMLPFFIIIFLWLLLKAVDKEEDKKRGYWLLLAATSFGFLAQFHFLALIILAVVAVLFLIYKRPHIKLLFWALSIGVVVFLHLPVIINDVKTGGDNAKLFMEAVTDKSENKKSHHLIEKVSQNYSENTLKYWIILTGSQTAELPSLAVNADAKKIDIQCDGGCRDNLIQGMLAFALFTLGIIMILLELFLEKDSRKKDFLVLGTILFIVSFGVFTPLAFDMSPRFFLIIIPLPFIFLGILIKRLGQLLRLSNFSWIIVIVLVAFNLYFTASFLMQLNNAKEEEVDLVTDKILKQKTRITLEQQKLITDHMESLYAQNKYPIFYTAQSEFHRAFAYLLDEKKIPRDGISKTAICREGNYFLILRTQSDLDNYKSYFKLFDLIEQKTFGTLTVFHLTPKLTAITCEKADQSKFRNYKNEGGAAAKRYNWNEVFEDSSSKK